MSLIATMFYGVCQKAVTSSRGLLVEVMQSTVMEPGRALKEPSKQGLMGLG